METRNNKHNKQEELKKELSELKVKQKEIQDNAAELDKQPTTLEKLENVFQLRLARDKTQSRIEAIEIEIQQLSQNIHYEYAKIHNDEIWRFYIDGHRQETKEGEERRDDLFDGAEPGYMRAMLNAHTYLNKTMNDKLTPKLIIDLHNIALTNVKGTHLTQLSDSFRPLEPVKVKNSISLNTDLNGEPYIYGNATPSGIEQFLKEITENNYENIFILGKKQSLQEIQEIPPIRQLKENAMKEYEDNNYRHGPLFYQMTFEIQKRQASSEWEHYHEALDEFKQTHDMKGEKCCELMKLIKENRIDLQTPSDLAWIENKVVEYIDHYNRDVGNAKNDDEKLNAIITLIQHLGKLHPFIDGNCRTFAMLLLNRELIRNNFPPTMLENPNRFEFFSREELKDELKNGWKRAEKYQSEIAKLPEFEKLYKYSDATKSSHSPQFFGSPKQNEHQALRELLIEIKSQPFNTAIEIIDAHLHSMDQEKSSEKREEAHSVTLLSNLRAAIFAMSDLEKNTQPSLNQQ